MNKEELIDEVLEGLTDETQEVLTGEPQEGLTDNETSSKFEITNVHIAILAILLLIITGFHGFNIYASKVTDPSYVAEQYINAKSTQDYSTMQQFFDPEIFDTDYNGVYEQEIQDITLNDLNLYTEYYGTDYIDYSYSYYADDDTQLKGGDVSLLLLPEKKWFLYDNWVIDPDYAILSDVRVKMLEPISATLGNMDLESIATKITDNTDGTVIYTLPPLLRGNYSIIVDYPFSDNVVYTLEVDYDSINNLTPELSTAQSLELAEMAEETLHQIYNKNFSTLTYDELKTELSLSNPIYFTEDQFDIKFNNPYSNIVFTDYTLSNIDTTMSILMKDANNTYSVNATITCDVDAIGSMDSSTNDEEYVGEIQGFTVYFEFDGTKWVTADIKPVYPL